MKRSLGLVLSLAVCAPLLGSCAPGPDASVARQPIINGVEDTTHTSVVALVALGSQFCSGTVIAPRAVLTAGHCIQEAGIDPTSMLIYYGDVVGGDAAMGRVVAATVHPQWYVAADGSPMYDVAVLTLAEDAPVKPMAWQRTPLGDLTGQQVTFVGYGVTDAQRQTGNGTRREVGGVITGSDDNFIYYGDGSSGTCQGDSGGPTLIRQGEIETVIAVTTAGDRTCVLDGENTRVDTYADFIAPLAPMPVALIVTDPGPDAYVGRDFAVTVDAQSPAGVASVTLLLDDEPVTTLTAAPFTFNLAAIADGDHVITLQATGADGGAGTTDQFVTVVTQELGVHCTANADCKSWLCAAAGTPEGFCTQACSSDADCPAHAACATIDGAKLCDRPGTAAGGCAAGGHARGGAGLLLGVILGLALARRGAGGRRRWRRAAVLVLALGCGLALAACGDNIRLYETDANLPPHGEHLRIDAAPDAPALDGGASGIGAACTATVSIGQGDCAAGLTCLTEQMTSGLATNGYCTLECGGGLGCPEDSVCVAVGSTTHLCVKQCASESDCRTADGYHCVANDQGQYCWTWRVPPGTNDGGACSSADGGPFVDDLGRVFGTSTQFTTPDGGVVESQPQVVAKGSLIAATYTSYGNSFGAGRLAVIASQNGGSSFGPAVLVRDTVNSRRSDSVLAIDPSGAHVYLAWVAYDRSSGQTSNYHVWVARSDDGGQTFDSAAITDASSTDSGTTTAMARPWIATGPGGAVYVAYAFGSGTGTAIKVARSTDDGATWDAPVRVDDGTRTTATRGLPHVAANGAGDLFVGWGEVGAGVPNGDDANDVYVARWAAGTAWGTFGANVRASADSDLVVANGLRVIPSPADDTVYLVYVAGDPDSLRWDIRMTWSDDAGDTFSAASIKINDDATCATHVLPTAAIDTQDRLHVTWYDNRFGNDAGGYYYAYWDPTAGTPSASEFVSDATFAFSTDARATNRLGNFAGLAVDGTSIYATWADPRGVANTSHIRFAKGPLP